MPIVTAKSSAQRDRLKVVLCLFNQTDESMRLDVDSFTRALQLKESQLTIVDMYKQAPTESMLQGVNALIIGGSRLSVWEEVPHGAELAAVAKVARSKKLPVLGICFGAQFLAHIFGGKVTRDNAREERGTYEITSSDDSFTDLLFADAPFSFLAQQAHQDCIVTPPTGAVVLASSELCPVQAFSISGADVYGVQFHPERSKADYERALQMRVDEGVFTADRATAIAGSLKETPDAEALLTRFIDRVVMGR